MLTPKEMKMLRLALDKGAYEGEADNAGVKLIRELRKRGIKADELFNQPTSKTNTQSSVTELGDTIMTFGKYKGDMIKYIPTNYLTWALDNCKNMKSSLRQAIHKYLYD